MPANQAEEDRLILLIMANAADACKLKPLLVHRSANSRALKDLVKRNLPVIWRQNSRAGVKVCIAV
jgi:hypothetical protein